MKSEKILRVNKILSTIVVFSIFYFVAFFHHYSNATTEDYMNFCKYFMTYYSPIFTGLAILSGVILVSFNVIIGLPSKNSEHSVVKNCFMIFIQLILLVCMIVFFGIALSQSL